MWQDLSVSAFCYKSKDYGPLLFRPFFEPNALKPLLRKGFSEYLDFDEPEKRFKCGNGGQVSNQASKQRQEV